MKQLGRLFTGVLTDLWRRPPGQMPALDVLRTGAVLIVIWRHTCVAYQEAGGAAGFLSECRVLAADWVGVNLFFVLSGYLIGMQLWRELAARGTVDFWRFVLRRGFRIWPLYFFFLVFVLLVLGRGDFWGGQGWSDAVFLTNYVHHGVVIGSWSLCTEEQFYLLAPLLLIVAAPYVRSVARYRRYLWLALLSLPAVRMWMWWRLTGDLSIHDPALFGKYIYQPIHSNCDGLLMGLILSNLAFERANSHTSQFSHRTGWILLALSCIALPGLRALQREVFSLTGMTFILGSLVWLALHSEAFLRRGGPLARILSARMFYILSRLSYGMYLNHSYLHGAVASFMLVFFPGRSAVPSMHLFLTECLVSVLSTGAAAVTYCVIEHPFLRLRELIVASRKAAQPQWPPCAVPESAQVASS